MKCESIRQFASRQNFAAAPSKNKFGLWIDATAYHPLTLILPLLLIIFLTPSLLPGQILLLCLGYSINSQHL